MPPMQTKFEAPQEISDGQHAPLVELSSHKALGDNLRALLAQRGMSQAQLAKTVGLNPRTVTNYLQLSTKPTLKTSKTGKLRSAKLYEIELIAKALGVETWELLRPMTQDEREFYRDVELAFRDLLEAAKHIDDPPEPNGLH